MSNTDPPTTSMELREAIFNISLRKINDIYYVPPGVSGSVGLSNDQIDKIISLLTSNQAALIVRIREEVMNDNDTPNVMIAMEHARQREALDTIANELKGESRG